MEFLYKLAYWVLTGLDIVAKWLYVNIYKPIKFAVNWPYEEEFAFKWVFLLGVLLILIILCVIRKIIKRCKKRKIKFYVNNKLVAVNKTKYKKPIDFVKVSLEGKQFVGWYKNRKCTKPYKHSVLKVKRNLKLFAKFKIAEPTPILINQASKKVKEPEFKEVASNEIQGKSNFIIENINVLDTQTTLGEFYDDIRFELLSYERALAFKKLGVVGKQIIAEMFEKDGQINLYLKIDPNLMKEKGYNVESYDDEIFNIVPCKKVVKTNEDFEESLRLINEVMTINNLVKSEVVYATKTISDEKTRKNGFAFFVKNETIASSSSDYYRILRAVVLSYTLSNKDALKVDDKMILKLFKKGEKVFLYLNLNAQEEGLQFVGYDKNFVDTPSMFEVKTAEDTFTAMELIDKLMYRNGMVKTPNKAEISFDDLVETNCGFGYKVKY